MSRIVYLQSPYITVGELYFGAEKRGWGERKRRALEATLRNFVVIPYDHGARHDAALLLRRQHLQRLVHRARAVQGPGLQQTLVESTHDQNLHLQVLAGASPLRSCHVIPTASPSPIDCHVAAIRQLDALLNRQLAANTIDK